MANTHLVYPDLAIDIISGTDPDQDSAEIFIQIIKRKSISFLEMHLEMLVNWHLHLQEEIAVFFFTPKTR